jgi:hypothetical protein
VSEFSFVGELDLEQLLGELRERGCEDVGLEVLTDDAGDARALRVSFGVRPRFELGAHSDGHRILSAAVRRSFTHRAVETGRLAAARARGR